MAVVFRGQSGILRNDMRCERLILRNHALHSLLRLLVVIWVDLLHKLDVPDELLVGALTRLHGVVLRVRLHRLRVRLEEVVDVGEAEVGVQHHVARSDLQRVLALAQCRGVVLNPELDHALV